MNLVGTPGLQLTVDQTSTIEGLEARDRRISTVSFSRVHHTFSAIVAVTTNLVFINGFLSLKPSSCQSPNIDVGLACLPGVG